MQCVGRVKLRELEQTEYQYAKAVVEPFTDAPCKAGLPSLRTPPSDPPSEESLPSEEPLLSEERAGTDAAARVVAEAAAAAGVSEAAVLAAATELLDNLDSEVRLVHESVRSMRSKLRREEEVSGDEEQVEWGHELRDQQSEADMPLSQIIEKRCERAPHPPTPSRGFQPLTCRRGVLTSVGLDSPPLEGLLEPLGEVWQVESEAQAEKQLLSFAAATSLSEEERAQAPCPPLCNFLREAPVSSHA